MDPTGFKLGNLHQKIWSLLKIKRPSQKIPEKFILLGL